MDFSIRESALKPLNANISTSTRKLRKWSTNSHLNSYLVDASECKTRGAKCTSENRQITNTIRQTLKKVNSNEEVLVSGGVNMEGIEMPEEANEVFGNMSPLPTNVVNLDAKKGDGMCPYPRHMYAYLRSQEDNFLTAVNGLKGKEVEMRTMLVDWLTEVQVYEGLYSESLHLSVALIDSFLAVQHVDIGRMQLLGIGALFVASKFVERFPPKCRTLCYYTDDSFRYIEVLRMEQSILRHFDFRINRPLPCHFLMRCLDASFDVPQSLQRTVRFLAMYLLEMILLHFNASSLRPSQRAAGAVLLARTLVCPELPPVTPTFAYYTGYSFDELKPSCKMFVMVLRDVMGDANQHQNITKKFSKAKYDEISMNPVLDDRRRLLSLLREFSD